MYTLQLDRKGEVPRRKADAALMMQELERAYEEWRAAALAVEEAERTLAQLEEARDAAHRRGYEIFERVADAMEQEGLGEPPDWIWPENWEV